MDGLAPHLRGEVPLHALMLGVMGITMAAPSAPLSLAGAALLVAVSVPCAALSRARGFLRAPVLDLWAMALVLIAALPAHRLPDAHHAVTLPGGVGLAVVVATWAAARVWLGMRGSRAARRGAVASGVVTAAGLAAMAVFCAPM